MKKLLSTENIIRVFVVIVLIAIASLKYDIKNVIVGLLIIFGMSLLCVSIVRLYQEVVDYSKSKQWGLSLTKSVLFASIIIALPVIFVFTLSSTLEIYAFGMVGAILLVLLLYDILKRIITRARR
jgi:hypothetical protein